MTLKKKLFSAFGGLVLFALLLTGMTLFVVNQWRVNEKLSNDHYQRSLSLQRIRAAMFRAFKEVPDAVTGDDPDSREEFDFYMKPVRADFEGWSRLAETQAEKAQVAEVRSALATLVKDAELAFTLVERGDRKAAFDLMEGRLEDKNFVRFDEVTARAVASDQEVRKQVRAQNVRAQNAARWALFATAISTLILSLLLAAYLGSDLFAPLKTVRQALDDATQGDKHGRLDEERNDEIGLINGAFNRLMESWERREKMFSLAGEDRKNGDESDSTKIALHAQISSLRSRAAQLKTSSPAEIQAAAAGLLSEIEALLKVVERVADFAMPLDLNLAKTDVRALLYELVARFQDQLLARGVNLEIGCDDDLQNATFDRLKIREALGQCVKNALGVLPERGGKLAIRARLDNLDNNNELVLEVACDGHSDESAVDSALAGREKTSETVGDIWQLTRATLQAHGGEMDVQSSPEKGTYVALRMPFRK